MFIGIVLRQGGTSVHGDGTELHREAMRSALRDNADRVAALPPIDVQRSRLLDVLLQREYRIHEWGRTTSDHFFALERRIRREAEILAIDEGFLNEALLAVSYAHGHLSGLLYGGESDVPTGRLPRALNIMRGGNEKTWSGVALRGVITMVEDSVHFLVARTERWSGPHRVRRKKAGCLWRLGDDEVLCNMFVRDVEQVPLKEVRQVLTRFGRDNGSSHVARVREEILSWPISRETPGERTAKELNANLSRRFGSAFTAPLEKVVMMLEGHVGTQKRPPFNGIVAELVWMAFTRAGGVAGSLDRTAYRFPFEPRDRNAILRHDELTSRAKRIREADEEEDSANPILPIIRFPNRDAAVSRLTAYFERVGDHLPRREQRE